MHKNIKLINNIKNFINLLKNKWHSCALREKILLSICGIIIGFFLLYSLFNLIYLFNVKNQQNILLDKQYILAKLIPAVEKINKIKSSTVKYKAIPSDNFAEFIKQSSSSLGLKDLNNEIYLIKNDIVRVDIREINFDSVISWLQNLHDIYGVKVIRANIDRVDKKIGVVKFMVELKI